MSLHLLSKRAVARTASVTSAFILCTSLLAAGVSPGPSVLSPLTPLALSRGATSSAGAAAAIPGTAPRTVVAVGEKGEPSEVVVAIDPILAQQESDEDYLSLFLEAAGTGRRTLRDGDVLSGRIVTEGIDFEPGATVYIEEGSTLIAMGDSVFDGRIVLFSADEPDAPPDVVEVFDDAASGPMSDAELEIEEAMSQMALGPPPSGPIPPSCPAVLKLPGIKGGKPLKFKIYFTGNGVIAGAFAAFCAGPIAAQLPTPDPAILIGGRSAKVTGGKGGKGGDLTVIGVGLSNLTIAGPICNGPGADGASAIAMGTDGPPCECGGDAFAIGGDGGDAGKLFISATNITWNMLAASITVYNGGLGGNASATGGAGGDCDVCGGTGGRGGHASAVGGRAGKDGRVTVAASNTMVPLPQVILAGPVFSFGPSPDGGSAVADAGVGGLGGSCLDCPGDAGDGGPGGNAYAKGGKGSPGVLLVSKVNGAQTAHLGSDGGDGGTADSFAGDGGDGGFGADCLCSFSGQAGDGGDGGAGGSATSRGGDGGLAKGGNAALALAIPVSGDGGDATAACGLGGFGGDGGSCLLDNPENCAPGAGGTGGPGGTSKASGGKRGSKQGAAVFGVHGTPLVTLVITCLSGLDGFSGLVDCPPLDEDGDCCLPHDSAGCKDPLCESIVCGMDPFCCDVLWDAICANEANQFCPICNDGSSDCCTSHNHPGCDDPQCVSIVCSIDPFCCEVSWDGICANEANQLCPVCNGGGGQSDCCVPHPGAGCSDPFCAEMVCSMAPFCCEFQWDGFCANLANKMCQVCAPAD